MEVSDAAARVLAALLESRTGQQLTEGRRWRIGTALQPLVRERALSGLDELVARLASDRSGELTGAVMDALLNNETFFYRDRQQFDLLLGPALARLEEARRSKRRLAIWCAGCSTGQEAYSLAMHVLGQPERWRGWQIGIAATDVSEAAVAQARSGVYSQFEVQRGLPVLQMIRWFDEYPGGAWRASEPLRRSVRFSVGSVLAAAPPTGGPFDILLCRNVLLYFAEPARRSALANLAAAAAEDAVLMLGAGETVGSQSDAFVPDPDSRGLYRRSALSRCGLRAAS